MADPFILVGSAIYLVAVLVGRLLLMRRYKLIHSGLPVSIPALVHLHSSHQRAAQSHDLAHHTEFHHVLECHYMERYECHRRRFLVRHIQQSRPDWPYWTVSKHLCYRLLYRSDHEKYGQVWRKRTEAVQDLGLCDQLRPTHRRWRSFLYLPASKICSSKKYWLSGQSSPARWLQV